MTDDRVSIVALVVTWNRLSQIMLTVERLLAEPLDRIVVVDNFSTDGTREWLTALSDPRIELVLPDRNLGGAGGFETGLRHVARTLNPDWTVVMDDDARPEPGAISDFRAAATAGWDALAAAVRYPDGQVCDMNRPVLNPFWHPKIFLRTFAGGGRAAFHLNEADYSIPGIRAIDGASFVGLFLSRRAIDMAGFPNGRLFLYAEDGLYTLGLTRAGGRIGFLPQVRFSHDCSTFSEGAGRCSPLWKAYYYHRNLMLLYRMAAGPVLFWPSTALIVVKWLFKARLYGAEQAKFRQLLRLAVQDALRGNLNRSHQDIVALSVRPENPAPQAVPPN